MPKKTINHQLVHKLRHLTLKNATYKDKASQKAVLETAKLGLKPSLTLITSLQPNQQSLTLKRGSHNPQSPNESFSEYISYSLPATDKLEAGTLLIDSHLTVTQLLSLLHCLPDKPKHP